MTATQPRFSFEALRLAAHADEPHLVQRSGTGRGGGRILLHMPIALLSIRTGFSRRRLQVWANDGIPLRSADKAACALGLHPWEIWGDAWWAA